MSLRLRLTLWYSGLLTGALIIFGVIVYLFINWNTYAELREMVKTESEGLVITGTLMLDKLDLNLDRQSRIEGKNIYVQLINYREGKYRQSTNLFEQNFVIPYPDASPSLQNGFVEVMVELDHKKYRMITYQRPLEINGVLVGLLQVGAIPYNEDQFLIGLRNTLLFSSVIVVLIAFTVGLIIARKALRPIENVINATKQIENGADLSVRIPMPIAKDEIGTLVTTLNMMLSRLEKAYNELDEAYMAQRRFVSDASHELRTPLTTIRGNIDLLDKMWKQTEQQSGAISDQLESVNLSGTHFELSYEAITDISAEAKRMSTLVNDLLALARADAGYVMEKEKVDIHSLTEAVVRRAQLLPREANWEVGDLSELKDVYIRGSEDYLQQLLFVFIENAFKYTPDGDVNFTVRRTEHHIAWIIEDNGIGMNPDQVPHIFDRFYRADVSRGVTVGTGLGLAIAKWILDEHQGSVEVATLEGKGTTFTVWLPIDFS
ncbi:MAG: HAMP domain-containing histidine kinase [Candidatus Pristimantibacillus lignocellulolyticus]|uniref:histidine kinase n=1 Tax=Candidatus Pristimantibacillus lignocellulolyticus TaxID=2994561 RepID=A0A9J6ZF97_9BACL|nr:MAG: HAMP domain-containing histidine kinase [Candidatus Pristimantibacillus lignocellulolyticus]